MRIYMINTVCGVGSTGRICTDLASVLIEKGNEARIAYGRGDSKVDYSYRIEGNKVINALKARLFDNEGFNAKKPTKKLIEDIKAFNPDIIHLHNIHGYYLNI